MQFVITSSAGKRLVAKALVRHHALQAALAKGTVVIVAGTTNGYVAEEILNTIDQAEGFDRRRFFRGITLPPSSKVTEAGRLPDEGQFPGDVVIENGQWSRGKTIFDVVDDLKEGDVVLKGANAVDLATRQAAVLIGHPKGGTIAAALQAVVGRRVRLILPVGLEKRVQKGLHELAGLVNEPGGKGARLFPVPGEVVTELEAVELATGAQAELVAGGGVCGAEGAVWLAISGSPESLNEAEELLSSIEGEPPFRH